MTTPLGPISNPLKNPAMSDSEALKGRPWSQTTLLRFLMPTKTQILIEVPNFQTGFLTGNFLQLCT
jgi:hypothetical protein